MIMAHYKCRYSNEAEKANIEIYDDFKLTKILWIFGLYKNILVLKGLMGIEVRSVCATRFENERLPSI